MDQNRSIEILKMAILLETRGKAFYSTCAKNSENIAVKGIFETLAMEEDAHIKFLSEQYKEIKKNNHFAAIDLPKDSITVDQILTEEIKKSLSAAGFEAAAISSAIDMENRAIAVYSEQANIATDPEEKKFYQWLADWEKEHHKLLHKLDQELKEKIWFDNNFWPF